MYHFFVDNDKVQKDYIIIEGSDVNHIKNVLRMKIGEEILISNRQSIDFCCIISDIRNEFVKAKIISTVENRELSAKIYLFQGLPKSDKLELIIQKAVELGVYEIVPVSTKRAIVRLDKKKEEIKIKRWQSIAESAAKQSKRSIIPKIKGIMSLSEALDYSREFESKLIPYENAEGMAGTRHLIQQIKSDMRVGIFIGPEGGFDETEIEQAVKNGYSPITLGKRILRTETAGMTILSIIMFHLECNDIEEKDSTVI